MEVKIGYVYKDSNSEYFLAESKDGRIVLTNPSYPFPFALNVLEDLEEMGVFSEFGHLIKKEDYEFHEGSELNVKINDDGDLEVIKDENNQGD